MALPSMKKLSLQVPEIPKVSPSTFKPYTSTLDYYSLRAQLLKENKLFKDPEFLPQDSSIFFSKIPLKPFVWKRPAEIVEKPQLFVDGATRLDVKQGRIGDCWLLAAISNLTMNKELLEFVVPTDQGFGENYAGIFHFRFWRYGQWLDVVIDDLLPTSDGKLSFVHSPVVNEFWSALLEKAYAKMHGSYEALDGGSSLEAMVDFTGGVSEIFRLKTEVQPKLDTLMLKAFERASLLGCSTERDPQVVEKQTPNGLVLGHAYSITNLKYVNIQTPKISGKIFLVRIRNPWGNAVEWKGAWSDRSAEWKYVSDEEKVTLGLVKEHDGEFWISFKDFVDNFSRLHICNLNPTSLTEDDASAEKKNWDLQAFDGEWVRGISAGGCIKYPDTFHLNPQYYVELKDPDENDADRTCTIIVALTQKHRRAMKYTGVKSLSIGYSIFRLKEPNTLTKPLKNEFFQTNKSLPKMPSYTLSREVSCRFNLPVGSYCIVPTTFEKDHEGDFILRVFSENKNTVEENEEVVTISEEDEMNTANVQEPVQELLGPVTDKLKGLYEQFAGEDMLVDWMELQETLSYYMRKEMDGIEFSKDVCRSMIAMMDTDHSGKLGFDEFMLLWGDIRKWRSVFSNYDKVASNSLSVYELRDALNSAGFKLNARVLNLLVHRYSSRDGNIAFDDFMMCAIRLKTMIRCFKKRSEGKNEAKFTIDEWIEHSMYS